MVISLNGKRFLIGFAIGSVIGGVSTLFTTPFSGSELRNRCKKFGRTIRTDIQRVSHDAKEVVTEIKEAKNIGSDIKESIDSWQEDISPALTKLQADVDALQTKIERVTKSPDKQDDRTDRK